MLARLHPNLIAQLLRRAHVTTRLRSQLTNRTITKHAHALGTAGARVARLYERYGLPVVRVLGGHFTRGVDLRKRFSRNVTAMMHAPRTTMTSCLKMYSSPLYGRG